MKRSENSASTRKIPKVQAPPTMELENQTDFGRVVWDEHGHVRKVVEVKDGTPEELEIKEFNVGVYCLGAEALKWAQPRLSDDNAQAEYYLTEVVHILADAGQRVETVQT
jgi:bifunctional UDP-N-acetylglucosamine pyrophosphorylase/glucosamine-1-phosphate N-acetyltransferase